MSRVRVYALSIAATGLVFVLPARGQAVISTRSGVVNYFEGTVSVAGQPLEARLGRYATIPEGGELRTAQGRAEVLLTPGVFLRVGEHSAIRMARSALADTRVEVLEGSAIVDTREPSPGTAVTMIYQRWSARQAQNGTYRIDCQPPRLVVREGEVEVSAAGGNAPVLVEQGMELPFAAVLAPETAGGDSNDALSQWSDGRADSISADNAIAANIQDPATAAGPDLPADAFTYFPMLGLAPVGLGVAGGYGSITSYPSGLYGVPSTYQPGFYSIYLPGYTYRPSLLTLPPLGGRSIYGPSIYGPSTYGPTYGRTRIGLPISPAPSPLHMPGLHPIAPGPMPHAPMHMGGHR